MNSRVAVRAMNRQEHRTIRSALDALVRRGDRHSIQHVPPLPALQLLGGQRHASAATRQIPAEKKRSLSNTSNSRDVRDEGSHHTVWPWPFCWNTELALGGRERADVRPDAALRLQAAATVNFTLAVAIRASGCCAAQ
jgi:hypothetical protein